MAEPCGLLRYLGALALAAELQWTGVRHVAAPFGAIHMLTLLLILLLVALVGGGLGHSRYGYAGWSPAGLLLVVVLVLFLTGTRL